MTWDNVGSISYFTEMKWFGSNLYMYIYAGQQYGNKTDGLYLFKSTAKKICYIKFSEPKDKIQNEEKTFDTLDLDKNKEVVSTALKKHYLTVKL